MIKYICNNCEKEVEQHKYIQELGICSVCNDKYIKERDDFDKDRKEKLKKIRDKYKINGQN